MYDKPLKAEVINVRDGDHGRYAVAMPQDESVLGNGKSVTFSLADKEVWNEPKEPKPGSIVVFEGLTEKVSGWRAEKARFSRPEDSSK